MSEPELTEAQLHELKNEIVRVQGELSAALSSLTEASEVVDLDQPIGRLSRMDAIQQQKMSQANLAATKRRLRLLEQAQTRLDGDEYGLCRECEEPISFRRLKARPEAFYCVGCQSRSEG